MVIYGYKKLPSLGVPRGSGVKILDFEIGQKKRNLIRFKRNLSIYMLNPL